MRLEHIRAVFFIFVQFYSCDIFVSVFFERRFKENLLLNMILCIVVCGIEMMYTKYLKDFVILKLILDIFIYVICMIFRFQGSVVKLFLCVVGYFSIYIISETIIVILSKIIIEDCSFWIEFKNISITVITIITKSIEMILLAKFQKISFKEKIFYQLGNREWIYFSLFWFSDVIVLLMIRAEEQIKCRIVFMIAFHLFILNVVFYLVMLEGGIKQKEDQKYGMIKEDIKEQLTQYQSMEKSYKEQRKIIHDFKSHIRYVQGLLEQNPEKAKEYIDTIYEKMQKESSPIRTGNSVVDIIVGQKYYEAKQKEIAFVLNLEKLNSLDIGEEDMIILLSNLLDNAIEACVKLEKAEDKVIKLTMIKKKNQFFIVVANKTAEQKTIENNRIETTKEDKQHHGIGMYSIQEIVQKYDAYHNCRYEKDWFIHTIVFLKE